MEYPRTPCCCLQRCGGLALPPPPPAAAVMHINARVMKGAAVLLMLHDFGGVTGAGYSGNLQDVPGSK